MLRKKISRGCGFDTRLQRTQPPASLEMTG